jgi:hypothetical protein
MPGVTGPPRVIEAVKLDGAVCASPIVGPTVPHALDPATWQVPVAETSRFATPAVYGGLVLVPTLAGVTYVRAS